MTPTFKPWLLAALLFAAALALFTRENRFPFYYHPDEPGKVEQAQRGNWNYHHPMLMLSTARLAVKAAGAGDDPQRVAEAGRWVSAGFAAGAVALLTGAVWLCGGAFAAAAAGVLLLTNHQLFELAHYFKEDTAFLFGLSAWLFALALFWRRPGWRTAALVGLGAALAVSGKYLGVAAPLLSFWLVPLRLPAGERRRGAAVFAGVLALGFVTVNFPMFAHLATFRSSLQREVGFVVSGQRGLTRSVPHTVYLSALRENVIFLLWPLLFLYYASAWRRWREVTGWERLFALFPVVYLVVLSFSPKTNDRYFLPATALFLCLVALGASEARRRGWVARLGAPLWLLLLAAVQLPGLVEYYRAFRRDDLAELTQWLNTEHPSAVLAQDRKVMLPSPRKKKFLAYQPPVRATVLRETVESFESVEELRAAGATHVILSESSYGRYRLKSLRPQAGNEEAHRKGGELYTALMEGNPVLWERPRGTVLYLHPGLEVYALPAAVNGRP